MIWDKEEEQIAKEEYLLMVSTLNLEEEFENEWKGHWDDKEVETFAGRISTIKGDRDKYMKYWVQNKIALEDVK